MKPVSVLFLLACALAACDREPVAETEPRQLNPPPFEYPEELWDAGVEGKTVLSIRVNEDGTVDSARVQTPSGHTGFDSAALAGTRALRFAPATRGGKPLARRVLLPVEFEITPRESPAPKAATQDAGTP